MDIKPHVLSVSSSISRLNGGVFEVQRNLAKQFSIRNIDQIVIGLEDEFTNTDFNRWAPVKPIVYKVIGPKVLGYSYDLLNDQRWDECNIGHLHSLWSFPAYSIFHWAIKHKKKYIISPNGMLNDMALKISKNKKKLATLLYHKRVIDQASCFIVNTKNEYEQIRNLGITSPVGILGNGILIPEIFNRKARWDKDPKKKYLLYLGRIHNSKGIEELLGAWKKLKSEELELNMNWVLVIVGFGFYNNTFENKIKQIINNTEELRDIIMLDGQYGEEMNACYEHCDAFILPSSNEGLPMAVLSAWSHKKPVLITPQCNLNEAYSIEAAIKIENNQNSIIDGLKLLFRYNKTELDRIGKNGYDLVVKKYTWESISIQTLEIYNWLLNPSNTVPNTILIN